MKGLEFKRILAIARATMQKAMVYRFDFFLFRLSNILEILLYALIWTVVFHNTQTISGYTYQEMMSYLIIGWVMIYLTANYGFEYWISNMVYKGELSALLIKPFSLISI